MRNRFFLFTVPLLLALEISGQQQNREFDLAGLTWRVWMDESAVWKADPLYLPSEVDLKTLPVNPPTCGWENLYQTGVESTLPVCVEELFSEGNPSWTYHGVSWFSAQLDVPAEWKDKVVRLLVGKKNMRIEIYINEKLAGYDIVSGTPYVCDLTDFVSPGAKNRIAFRITNPGGQRGWNDFPLIKWGNYRLPPSRDFGAWFARPDNLLVLIGEIEYGKGKILLAPSYPIDENEAFNDMLFFNMIKSSVQKPPKK